MKLTGKVLSSDLEGGLWLFEADNGTTYQLKGGDGGLLQDGIKATLEGSVPSDGGFGIGMAGEVFEVSTYTIID